MSSHDRGATAGSDGERRLALRLADELRASGREARVVTFWVRPASWLVHASATLIAVAGSLLAPSAAVAGLALCGVALAIVLAELAPGSLPRRLTIVRATQDVCSPPPARRGTRPLTLIISAALDRPRLSLARRLGLALVAIELAAIVLLTSSAVARVAGLDGLGVDLVAVAATILLLVTGAAFLDEGLAAPARGDGAAVAASALAEALDAEPPRSFDVALVLLGAGTTRGIRDPGRLRAADPDRAPADAPVLTIAAGGRRGPRWSRRVTAALSLAAHPQLLAAANAAAARRPELEAQALRHLESGPAALARRAGHPSLAVALGADDGIGQAFALELVRRLDDELQSRERR